MVLVIIGVVMGSVMVGTDVLRHAKGQKAFSDFVVAWRDAFIQYHKVVGVVPGDNLASPANAVGGQVKRLLCDPNPSPGPNAGVPFPLSDTFLSQGIRIPQGRGLAMHSLYGYQDSTGSPQELQVCFETVTNWSAQAGTVSTFQGRPRHVMRITGLTVELAMQMDVLVDGNLSARFGQFRSINAFSSTASTDAGWGSVAANPQSTDAPRSLVTAYFEVF